MWKRLDRKLSNSKKHPKVSDFAFRVWAHALPWADVRGVYPRDPVLVRSVCMPRYQDLRLDQVDTALSELSEVRLIHLFDVGGERYLVFHDHDEWNPMVKMRNQRPEWPAPPRGLCDSPSCPSGGGPLAAGKTVTSTSVPRAGPTEWGTSYERRAHDVVTSCLVKRGGVGGRVDPADPAGLIEAMTPASARATLAMARQAGISFAPEQQAMLESLAKETR